MPSPKTLATNGGSITIELLVAIMIFAATNAAIMQLLFTNQQITTKSAGWLAAQDNAETTLVKWHKLARTDFESIPAVSHTNNYTKQAVIDAGLADISIYFVDLLAAKEARTCPDTDPKQWLMPKIRSTINIDNSDEPNTIATGLAVKNNFVYLAADSPTLNKSDLFTIDVSDPDLPITTASSTSGPGLNAITLADNFIYAGNSSINAQLQIFNLDNPAHPQLVRNYKLPGVYADATANSIFYLKKKVYLGTNKSTIAEFHIIDVSDPYNPISLGSYEFNTTVNNIYVRDGLAYVATPDDNEIIILDIRKPDQINQVGEFNAPGGLGNGKSLELFGDNLYLGRTVGGSEWYTLNVASSTDIKIVNNTDLNTSINNLLILGKTLFLGTIKNTKELQIFDLSDPANPKNISTLDLPAKITDLDCDDDLIYAALGSETGLVIISP